MRLVFSVLLTVTMSLFALAASASESSAERDLINTMLERVEGNLCTAMNGRSNQSYSLTYEIEANVMYEGPMSSLKNNSTALSQILYRINHGYYDIETSSFKINGKQLIKTAEDRNMFFKNQWLIFTPSRDPNIPGIMTYDEIGNGDVKPIYHYMPTLNLDLTGCRLPFHKILRLSESRIMGIQKDTLIGAHACVLVEADTPYGHYRLWLDPSANYLPRKAVVAQGPQDWIMQNTPVSNPYTSDQIKQIKGAGLTVPPTEKSIVTTLDSVAIEEHNGIFFVVSGNLISEVDYEDGSRRISKSNIRVENIETDPDFTKLGAFSTNFIPDGTKVRNSAMSEYLYTWQSGGLRPYINESFLKEIDDNLGKAELAIEHSRRDTNRRESSFDDGGQKSFERSKQDYAMEQQAVRHASYMKLIAFAFAAILLAGVVFFAFFVKRKGIL